MNDVGVVLSVEVPADEDGRTGETQLHAISRPVPQWLARVVHELHADARNAICAISLVCDLESPSHAVTGAAKGVGFIRQGRRTPRNSVCVARNGRRLMLQRRPNELVQAQGCGFERGGVAAAVA